MRSVRVVIFPEWVTMREKLKQSAPVAVILVLASIGIIGYSTEKKSAPLRVWFKTTGGDVVYPHQSHVADYGLENCQDCHHNIVPPSPPDDWKCRTCHRAGTDLDNLCEDRAPHQQCIGAKCIDCHKEMGRDEKECSLCHRQ